MRPEEREKKEQLLALMLEEKNNRDINRLKAYKPHAGFQEAFFKSNASVRLVTAGNQPLCLETMVLTIDGEKKLRDIKAGDFVFSVDGNPCMVNYIIRPGVQDVYRITMKNGDVVEATENHPFYAYTSQRKRESRRQQVLTIKELSKLSDAKLIYIDRVNFYKKPSFDPFLLGLFLGDGCSQQAGKGCHKDSFTNNNEFLHEEFKKRVEVLGDKIIRYPSNPQQAYITKGYLGGRVTTVFTRELKRLGLYEKKSWEKFIPDEFLSCDNESRINLVRGLVLTDGCVDKNRVTVYSNSKKLLDSLLKIYRSFGVFGNVQERKVRSDKHRNQFYLCVSLYELHKKGFYFDFKESNYRGKVRDFKNYCGIKSIDYIGKKEVGCINIDHPSHLFVLANGILTRNSGKTHSAAVEAAMYALGIHPYKKIRVPNVGLIVSGQAFKTGIEQIIVPKLKQVTGINDIVEIKNNSQGNPVKIIWSNNSITHLMSAEQDIEAFEGTTTGWAWVDEPISREIFIAIKRGMLTTGGHFWMTCTPLSEPWIYEDLYLAGISKADPNIECFVGSSDENIHISDEAKIEFKKHLTEDEIDIRWYGKFRHLTGRVFKSYKPEIHKIPAFDIPPHWPVYVAIDPHKQKPHAVIFLAVAPNNNKYICNEIYVKCGITQLAEHILDIGSQYNIVKRLIDSSASELDFERRETAKSMLSKAGVQTQVARKANLKNTGIMLINELFQKDELFVFEHCTRTHRELQNQIFQQNKRDPSVLMEEPQKKFDDATDCIRYILVERPTYRDNARIKMQEAPYVRKYV